MLQRRWWMRLIVATVSSNASWNRPWMRCNNLGERLADAGYRSESNLGCWNVRLTGHVAMGREKNLAEKDTAVPDEKDENQARDRYRARKHIGEPPFGWIKSSDSDSQSSGLDTAAHSGGELTADERDDRMGIIRKTGDTRPITGIRTALNSS